MEERDVMTLVEKAASLPELIQQLHQQGADKVWFAIAMNRFLSFRARERAIPIGGHFELTPLCNLDCKMCYVHLRPDQMGGKKLLPTEDWEKLMEQAVEQGMMFASLTGGECLTHPDFDRLYTFLHSRGVQITVLTNGVLLDAKRVEFFLRHPPGIIQVTLYGADEDTYEQVTGQRVFARVVENIHRAKEAGLPLVIALTPSRYLGDADEKLLRFAATLGLQFHVNSGLITPREGTGRENETHDEEIGDYIRLYTLERELTGGMPLTECQQELPATGGKEITAPKGVRCGAGRSGFTITWEGTMLPCANLRDIMAWPFLEGFTFAWKTIHGQVMEYPLPMECEGCAYRHAATTCVAMHREGALPGHANPHQCQRCRALVEAGFATLAQD